MVLFLQGYGRLSIKKHFRKGEVLNKVYQSLNITYRHHSSKLP